MALLQVLVDLLAMVLDPVYSIKPLALISLAMILVPILKQPKSTVNVRKNRDRDDWLPCNSDTQ